MLVATGLSRALSQKKFVVQFLKPGEKKEKEGGELFNWKQSTLSINMGNC